MPAMTRHSLLSGLSTYVIGSRHTIALAAPGGAVRCSSQMDSPCSNI